MGTAKKDELTKEIAKR